MILLDGKQLSQEISKDLLNKVSQLSQPPVLVVIQVGDNPSSNTYIKGKIKYGHNIGVEVRVQKFNDDVTEDVLLEAINFCNESSEINGVIVQLPLPLHINKEKLLDSIYYKKDVDGLSSINLGKLLKRLPDGKLPATPKGIITLLKKYNIEINGKNAVIIGRSNLVGLPLSILLTQNNATVTLAHSKTNNLQEIARHADILISACGVPHLIKKDFVKDNAVVIDVGNSYIENKLLGDVDFEDVKDIVYAISPVPGGVGPMTITSLFENLLN